MIYLLEKIWDGRWVTYQLYKKESKAGVGLSQPLAYIVNYRASHSFKYLLSRITGILYYVGSFGKPYYPVQTEGINRLLVNEYAHILQAFLTEADNNFEETLSLAVDQIMSPEFGRKSGNTFFQVNQSAVILQTRNEFNSYQNSSHYFNEYITVNAAAGIKGKEKGVFSKKQILILFDLLAETGKMEKIDFTKPNKFDSIADLLCAITGKSKDSWVEQLKDCRNKGLYEFKNEGERKQLIVTLTNLAEIFRKAGFRSIGIVSDKKLRELEKHNLTDK